MFDWLFEQLGRPLDKGNVQHKYPGECKGYYAKCYNCSQVSVKKHGKVFAVRAGRPYERAFRGGKPHWSPNWFCGQCLSHGHKLESQGHYDGSIEAEKADWLQRSWHGEYL